MRRRQHHGMDRHTDDVTGEGLDVLGADQAGLVLSPVVEGGMSAPLVVVSAGTSEEGRSSDDGSLHIG